VTTFVARHFKPDQATKRDCRQSMSAQVYEGVCVHAVSAMARKAAKKTNEATVRMEFQGGRDEATAPARI
jgi:hypothetical protein